MGEGVSAPGSTARAKRTVNNVALRAAFGWFLIACSIALASPLGPVPAHSVSRLTALVLGGLGWLLAIGAARSGKIGATAVIVGGVLLRLIAFAGDPGLSDDGFRYVWEGGLVAEGISPYTHAPASPELADQRARWSVINAGVNHPEVSAAYPPLAQAVMAAATALAGGPSHPERALLAQRFAFGLFDLLTLIPILLLLRGMKKPLGLALVWAWSPLVLIEYAGSGHLDSLMIALAMAGLAFSARKHHHLAVAALMAGAMAKLLPVLLIPLVMRKSADWRTRGTQLLVAVGTALAIVAPFFFLRGGYEGLWRGLGEYGFRWEAASLVHRFIEPMLAGLLPMDESGFDSRRVARACLGLIWLTIAWRSWRRNDCVLQTSFVWIGALLVLSPTLHPWYLTWVIPFLAFYPSRAWFHLILVAPLLYAPLAGWIDGGEWVEPKWLWPLMALPAAWLWARDRFFRSRPIREKRQPSSSDGQQQRIR